MAETPEPEAQPTPDADAAADFRDPILPRFLGTPRSYFATRFFLLRLLGLVYFVAFGSLALQLDPLLGSGGLLPAADFLTWVRAGSRSTAAACWRLPTLFWLSASDAALHAACWAGVVLSLAVLAGATNAFLQLALWALYLSFVHVGQIFYGYGWESQLLETGFLAVFLCPLWSVRPFPASPPPRVVIVLFRWLIFRVMLGAGLIKLRGDPCWRDLTCLVYHYETQPIPSPLSYLFHRLPRAVHELGVLASHGVELVAPWFAFWPRRGRLVVGALMIGFQIVLILSGNLSFLNWLTIVPAIACFDDDLLDRLLPASTRARVRALAASAEPSRAQRAVSWGLGLLIAALSVEPVTNLLSPRQVMNASFTQLELVNTYGAFGSVGRERYEVILEGTDDAVLHEGTRWKEYELPCKPGDVRRRPCLVTPYHYRLDWQMWFLPFSRGSVEPWFVHLVYQLLHGDRGVMRLFANDPFPDHPPRYVRALLYRYTFTRPGDGSGAWWRRTPAGTYLRPLSLDDPDLQEAVRAMGWR